MGRCKDEESHGWGGEERRVGASVAFSLPEMWTPAAQGGMETVNAQCVGHIGLRVVN